MANRNTCRGRRLDRQLTRQGKDTGFRFGPVLFGRAVNSSLERKKRGKKPYSAPTRS